jgi:hypothetical protein
LPPSSAPVVAVPNLESESLSNFETHKEIKQLQELPKSQRIEEIAIH